jgi:hypothetical protein
VEVHLLQEQELLLWVLHPLAQQPQQLVVPHQLPLVVLPSCKLTMTIRYNNNYHNLN